MDSKTILVVDDYQEQNRQVMNAVRLMQGYVALGMAENPFSQMYTNDPLFAPRTFKPKPQVRCLADGCFEMAVKNGVCSAACHAYVRERQRQR